MIDKLTERIADRLRSELRVELQVRACAAAPAPQPGGARLLAECGRQGCRRGAAGATLLLLLRPPAPPAQKESESWAARAQATSAALDGFLGKELEAQNSCPICYELMVPPERAPQLLVPCGAGAAWLGLQGWPGHACHVRVARRMSCPRLVRPHTPPFTRAHAGHTFCAACTSAHIERMAKTHCPLCRERIKSRVRG